jgi:hypothetical protein
VRKPPIKRPLGRPRKKWEDSNTDLRDTMYKDGGRMVGVGSGSY